MVLSISPSLVSVPAAGVGPLLKSTPTVPSIVPAFCTLAPAPAAPAEIRAPSNAPEIVAAVPALSIVPPAVRSTPRPDAPELSIVPELVTVPPFMKTPWVVGCWPVRMVERDGMHTTDCGWARS